MNHSLRRYIEIEILPRYDNFDAAHGRSHVNWVVGESMALAQHLTEEDPNLPIDEQMVYVIAAYHDVGLAVDRATHHLVSARMLRDDRQLSQWFSPGQILQMAEAVEDHRASSDHEPRSIYGCIVAEADRDLEPEIVLRRTVQYGLSVYPEKNREEHWRRFCQHLHDKYSATGYIRLWLRNSASENHLQQLRSMIDNPSLLRQNFDRLFDEEKRLRQV